MLLIWFGESPALFQDYRFLTVHFREAPGVAEGIPVRKSGIRIGQVAAIEFDRRPNAGDGVLVTLALDPKYRIAAGSIPRLSRALIGDVSIDLLPSQQNQPGDLVLSRSPSEAARDERIVEGVVAPDPALALAAATEAFERAGATLTAIETAAAGISKVAEQAPSLDDFLTTWSATGKKVGALSDRLEQVVAENEAQLKPTIDEIRLAASRIQSTLDDPTREHLQTTAQNLASGSARLDQLLAELAPLAADLSATAGAHPTTQAGQTLVRLNRISYEVGLLTAALADPSGRRLNPNGTLQKLVMQGDAYDNVNRAALGIQEVFTALRPMIRSLNEFADRIARDPAAIGRGALRSP
jgi:phospholipid/cholesterol/gamma-HCH transport system substrate-binding protein